MKSQDVAIDGVISTYIYKLPSINKDFILFGCSKKRLQCYYSPFVCALDPNCFMVENLIQVITDRNVTKNIDNGTNRHIDVYIKNIYPAFYEQFLAFKLVRRNDLATPLELYDKPSYTVARRNYQNLAYTERNTDRFDNVECEPYTRYHTINTYDFSTCILSLSMYSRIMGDKDFEKMVKNLIMSKVYEIATGINTK